MINKYTAFIMESREEKFTATIEINSQQAQNRLR